MPGTNTTESVQHTRTSRSPQDWYDELARRGNNDAHHWLVVNRPIVAAEWLAIDDAKTGEPLWRPETGLLATATWPTKPTADADDQAADD